MKKTIPIVLLSCLLVSCNFSLFNATLKDMTTPTPPTFENPTSPLSPNSQIQGVRCSDGLYLDKITISWNKLTGADLYRVEKAPLEASTPTESSLKELTDSDWEFVTLTPSSNYDDKKFENKGVYYAYRVIGVSLSYNTESKPSATIYGSVLSPVTEIDCTKGTSEENITITYSQVPGAEYYHLYKNTSEIFTDNLVEIDKKSQFSSSSKTPSFTYTPDASEKGKVLYFSIKASSSRVQSGFSEARSGYTKVQGAPTKPVLLTNKGRSTSNITLTFTPFDEGTSFYISRSKNGGKETLIYNSEDYSDTEKKDEDPIEKDDFGKLVYVDTDTTIEENAEFIYSVYGTNALGTGEAATEKAYLLSSVKDVSLVGITENDKLGYRLEVTPPFASTENLDDWMYIIQVDKYSPSSSSIINETIEVFPIDNIDTVVPFFSVTPLGTEDEIRKVSIKVKSKESSEVTKEKTAEVQGIPKITESFTFSGTKNVYDSSIGAATSCTGGCLDENGNKRTYKGGTLCYCIGVYPVILRWSKVEGAHHYRIIRNDGREWTTDELKYNDKAVAVGKKYTYTIYAEDALNRHYETENDYRKAEDCYGALTPEQFLFEFERHVEKPWEFQDEHPLYHQSRSKGTIWNYIRQSGTGSLGSGSANDDYVSSPRTDGSSGGQVTYSAVMSGLAGKVTFTMTEGFGETDYIYFTHDDTRENPSGTTVNVNKNQGYTFTANMDGNADSYTTISNNNVYYVDGWYGKNAIEVVTMRVESQHLVGRFRPIITYNTLDGGTIKKSDTTVEPIKYRFTEGRVQSW